MLLDGTNYDAVLSTLNLYTPSTTFASRSNYSASSNTSIIYRVRQKEHPDLGGSQLRVGSAYSGWERVQWWGARRRTAVYVPFSVYTIAWLGEHRAFIVEEFIKKMVGRR